MVHFSADTTEKRLSTHSPSLHVYSMPALLPVGRERAQAAQVRAVGRILRRLGQGKEVNALGRQSRGQMRKKSSQGASFEAIGKINQGSVLGGGGGGRTSGGDLAAGESGGRERHPGA